jgi:hypothetical protein
MDSMERKSCDRKIMARRVFSRHIFSRHVFSSLFTVLATFHLPEIFHIQKIYFLAPTAKSKRLDVNDFWIVFALPML